MGGYILPKQQDVLFGVPQIMARLEGMRVLALSTMEFKNFGLRFANRFSVNARNISSYNNSFPELVKDLKIYKKKDIIKKNKEAYHEKEKWIDCSFFNILLLFGLFNDNVIKLSEKCGNQTNASINKRRYKKNFK